MKSILNRILALLVIGTFTSALAVAKITKKEITITSPVTVNGTLVKKGTYKMTYDDKTGELTIAKGKKVVATAPARLDKTNDRVSTYVSASNDPSKPPALLSVF